MGVGALPQLNWEAPTGFFRQEVSSVPWRCVGFWRKFYLSWAAAAGSLAKMGWVGWICSWVDWEVQNWYNPGGGGGFNVETASMASECIWYNMSQFSAIQVACVAWFWNLCRFWLGFCWFGAWMLILMFHCITDRCLLLWIKCALHAFGEKCCIRKINIYWHRNGAKAGQAQHNLLEFGRTRMTLWMYAFQIVTIHRYSLYLRSTFCIDLAQLARIQIWFTRLRI